MSSKLFSLLENNHTRVISFSFLVVSCYVYARDKKELKTFSRIDICRESKKSQIVMKLCLRICTRV